MSTKRGSRSILPVVFLLAGMLSVGSAVTCDEYAAYRGTVFDGMQSQMLQSPHPYCNNQEVYQSYNFTDSSVTHLKIVFDEECKIEVFDSLDISYDYKNQTFTWLYPSAGFNNLIIPNHAFNLTFTSDSSYSYYGYSFEVTPMTGDFELNDCESFAGNPGETFNGIDPQVIESPHPYCDNMVVNQSYIFANSSITQIRMVFDTQTEIESYDSLTISYGHVVKTFGRYDIPDYIISGGEFNLTFRSDFSVSFWGYSINLVPIQQGHEVLTCETFQASEGTSFNDTSAHIIKTPHPYCNDMTVSQHYSFVNETVSEIKVEFSDLSSIAYDRLEVFFDAGDRHITYSFFEKDLSGFIIEGREFGLTFNSNYAVTDYGFDMTITPLLAQPHTPCDNYKVDPGAIFSGLDAQVIESPHPYCSDLNVSQHYSFTDSSVTQLTLSFDLESSIEVVFDMLTISHTKADGTEVGNRYSGDGDFSELVIDTDEFDLKFVTDSIYTMYGYRITVIPGTVTTVTTQSQCKQTMTQEDLDNEMLMLREYYYKLN
mmetsp:Transcript_60020/g.68274  ORF Transcript_60020/g.68274 Transcript_60020/m.68274 type:complete len:541 (+) Transcript_60020:89-1711(+)